MSALSSLRELSAYRHGVIVERQQRPERPTLVVCAGTGGQASGSNDIIRVIKRHILQNGLSERIRLRITGCQGFCEMDPFIVVEPGQQLYPRLTMEDVPLVISAALGGYVVERLLYREPGETTRYDCQTHIPFFKKQTRTILGNNQRLDPIRIVNYVEEGGYAALEKVLQKNDTDWLIGEVRRSGLRGRGGAGFPTGVKWERARAAGNGRGQKYMVCNCDEGDPGAYMDRSLLEGNPHAIIEGLTIAGIAIGAARGIIYVRTEYPLAIKHTMIALRQARELGLLGQDILGTGIDFDIEIVRGAGAFVCGEETALIRSVEGFMGEPRQRPPYPVERGIDGCPTCINNVETLANVPVIVNRGAVEYATVGVPGNTGTKIFSLVGKVRNTGLVEVPMGITIREIVHGIGGGSSSGLPIKAVQTGGPSGGCIPAHMFDLPIDFDSLAQAGSIMGSGGMIVMDSNTCMVDVAKYFTAFLKDESCGKCFTCRKGTQRMWEILDDISRGRGTLSQLDLLEELALVVRDTTMCGLGQTASNPVLSTLRYFRDEYERHIVDKRCDAFVCSDLVGAPCQSACPVGTEAWRYVAHIARGEIDQAYRVIREANPFPSVCARVCNHPCEEHCRAGVTGTTPVAIRALKRFVTDRCDPLSFRSQPEEGATGGGRRVAVVGAGPAGLTAAHYLSLKGYRVTVYEQEAEPGGMLFSAIPAYRLPHDIVRREIEALLGDGIELRCNRTLGREITLDGLLEGGFGAVFVALGAHKSLRLDLPDEDAAGVIPSISFLKAFNLRGEELAEGRVGVIGGGNSALDAARVALRQKGVDRVTIFYRRTLKEMPAFAEEIEAAMQEGVAIEPLTTPVRILTKDGALTGVEFVRNRLGDIDESGRRRPFPMPGTEHRVPLDTLIVAISEGSDTDCVSVAGANRLEINPNSTVRVNLETLATNRPGVFAGGDVVSGPNTVIDAVAAGKRAATMIDRYLRAEPLVQPREPKLPREYVAPPLIPETEEVPTERVELPRLSVQARRKSFAEVEAALSEKRAIEEARRCLRCDLTFTQDRAREEGLRAKGGRA
jgi:NADH-quinone oxidoreductase subunit F